MKRKPLVAGNWKMHGGLAFIDQYASELHKALPMPGCELVLFPPVCFLAQLAERVRDLPVAVGAQSTHWESSGAFTGETAPQMVVELGAAWTLVGHSERRSGCGETDEVVAAKVVAALSTGLQPVLCVGENLAERDAGSAEAVVARQLQAVLARVGIAGILATTLAYEPVWAIGTGRTATPEQAQDMHGFLRALLRSEIGAEATGVRLLYGGSVTPENASALFAEPDVDGVLVGGASLVAERLIAIARAAQASNVH